MSCSNLLDVATVEMTAEKDFASKDMPKAESKGILAAIPVERRDTFVANDDIASANISETDAFSSRATQEDVHAKFDNFIKQVKAGGVEVMEIDHRTYRLTVHACAGTGKGFWVANTTAWLKELHKA